MASNPTATLTALLQGATIEDHEDVLKAANAVLRSSKNQPEALHTRVVALLKLDRFDDALRALDEGGDKLAERCVLEKSYSLYKTGKLTEAEQLARGKDSRGLLHVAAQVAYRQEEFEVAASLYKQLSAQAAVIEGEDNDLRINSSATDAQLEWQGNGDMVEPGRKKPGREDLEAFETSYNAACGCIARGDLAAGSVLLKRARDLCEALDELSGEEKRAEILPIMVQQAYVFTKLGKVEEAEAIQKMIQVADVPEPPTRVIAINNSLATSATENPYMSERIFDSVPTLSHTDQLFEHQESLLRQNRYAIDLQSQKYPGVGRSTWSIISKAQSPTISPYLSTLSVLNAASFARGETGKTSLKRIQPLLEKRPNDVGLLLTVIQLYVLTDSPGSAIALLENFIKRLETSATPSDLNVCFAPGITALLVSLYRVCGRKAPIRVALAKAASHWRRKASPSKPLLRAAGISLLDSSKPEDLAAAGEIFTSLRSQDATDKIAIAGFVSSYATTDLEKVTPDLEKLTPVSRLTAGIDASALEEAGVPSLPQSTLTQTTKKRAADPNPTTSAPKKRKLRPSKLPKEYVEGKTPDPERWLPLRDRSSYRPKGKKGKKKAMEMTQGGVVRGGGEEGGGGESLELAGGAGSVRVERSGGGGGGGAGQQGKKKKKGKK